MNEYQRHWQRRQPSETGGMNEWSQRPLSRVQLHLVTLILEHLMGEVKEVQEQLAQLKDELDHTQGEIWSAHSNGRHD